MMRTLEITLSEEQYQHTQEEVKYGGRTMLEKETLGGFEITLHVGVPTPLYLSRDAPGFQCVPLLYARTNPSK
ncbi:hypothetical protein DET49_104145 [Salegentibacter sp. 24]|nr:hypothetical protein DET49_104145 [Salegentibacter sp. 24]